MVAESPELDAAPASPPRGAARHEWLLWLIGSGGVLLLAAVLRFQPPRSIVVPLLDLQLPQMCATQRMFSIDCPGCGLTRCFVLAAHGQWSEAVGVHPVGSVFFLLLVLQIPWRLWQGWRTFRGGYVARTGRLEWTTAAVLTAAAFLWWAAKASGLVAAVTP